ncbi:MAG: hypothetical protein GY865_19670 [candidate division Zixibacteria bacterium]|nr:hypothetical protein [candidate division Zixibacteria bacterium]
MTDKNEQIAKKLTKIYKGYITVLITILIIGALIPMSLNSNGYEILFHIVMVQIFFITPLLIPFFILNVYGAIRFKTNRLRYLITIVILIPTIIWGTYNILYGQMP